jgi:RNA polymerase sigma-70 factor (ECF subfamily)
MTVSEFSELDDAVVAATSVADGIAEFTAIVDRMRAGDEAAFTVVYRTVQPPLLRYLSVLVGSTDAEDVASETWSQACRDLGSFSGDGDGFRGWVATIGRHRALDHLRARGRRPLADVRVEDVSNLPHVADAESAALESIETAKALRLIATLPQDQAEAVLLRAVMGLDAKTTGRVLGKRAGAVRTSAYRGLKALGERLAGPEPDIPVERAAEGDNPTTAEEVT